MSLRLHLSTLVRVSRSPTSQHIKSNGISKYSYACISPGPSQHYMSNEVNRLKALTVQFYDVFMNFFMPLHFIWWSLFPTQTIQYLSESCSLYPLLAISLCIYIYIFILLYILYIATGHKHIKAYSLTSSNATRVHACNGTLRCSYNPSFLAVHITYQIKYQSGFPGNKSNSLCKPPFGVTSPDATAICTMKLWYIPIHDGIMGLMCMHVFQSGFRRSLQFGGPNLIQLRHDINLTGPTFWTALAGAEMLQNIGQIHSDLLGSKLEIANVSVVCEITEFFGEEKIIGTCYSPVLLLICHQ